MRLLLLSMAMLLSFSASAQKDTAGISSGDSTAIGFAVHDLYHKLPEGPLGNFIADGIKTAVQLKWGNKIDIALVAPQSIRGKIAKGPFKKNQLLKLLPYEDSIAVMKVNGAQLKPMLDKIASLGGYAVAGLQMQINNMQADSIFINREPLDSAREYMLAIPYYLLVKKRIPVPDNIPVFNADLTMRRAICAYIQWLTNTGKTIWPVPYRRIRYAN